jgi:two-component system CheB/CheR fusion protein
VGIRAGEAEGNPLLTLGIGLPLRDITPLLKQMLRTREQGSQRIALEAVNRRGRTVQLEIECCLLLDADEQIKGAILVMNQVAEKPTAG